MIKARPTADFRPVKPNLEPPEPAPKPNIRLSGVLRAPDGRTLLNPPTIELNEFSKQPSPLPTTTPKKMIPSAFKESVTHSSRSAVPVEELSFREPFLYESLPTIEKPKTIFDKFDAKFDKKLFYAQKEPIEPFRSKIDRINKSQPTTPLSDHFPEIPPLPNWERNFEEQPAPVTTSSLSDSLSDSLSESSFSDETNLEEFQLNEHFDDIDVFLTRNKMKLQSAENTDSVQENNSESRKNSETNKISEIKTDSKTKSNSEQKRIILPVMHLVYRNHGTVFHRKRSVSVLKSSVAKTSEHSVIPLATPVSELLRTENLTKSYYRKRLKIPVLKGVNLSVRSGEFVAIIGQSGSGKSTLLHLLGTLDNPESGSIYFENQRIDNLPVVRRDHLRNRSIGFIFQFYHLLPELTTLENVLSPLMIREGIFSYIFRRGLYLEKAKLLLEKVGLSHRLKHKPCELSGGEMQRAAIARALISEPKILLADEPTGNLDAASAAEIMELLQQLNKEQKLTIVMVTHDNTIANTADRIVRMVDGIIV
ncbi:MAG: ABC transporter ATP-binding protein [Planctomycetaceae bacterium]|jgi:lipoprotein-releasing system ATP-binding protein|nr:ABC transporter ATP-binding protein [Planctomycetaceae bacterium]